MRLAAALAVLAMLLPVYAATVCPGAGEGDRVVLRIVVGGTPLAGVRVALSRYRVSGYPGLILAENTTDANGYVVLWPDAEAGNLYIYVQHPVYGVLDLDPSSAYSAGAPLSDVAADGGVLDINIYGGYSRVSYELRLNITDEYLEPIEEVRVVLMYRDHIVDEARTAGNAVYVPSSILLMGPGILFSDYRVVIEAGDGSIAEDGLPSIVSRVIDMHPPRIMWGNATVVYNEYGEYLNISVRISFSDGVNTMKVRGIGTIAVACGGCVNRTYVLDTRGPYLNSGGVLVFTTNKLLASIIREPGANHTIYIYYNASLVDPGGHVSVASGMLIYNYVSPSTRGGNNGSTADSSAVAQPVADGFHGRNISVSGDVALPQRTRRAGESYPLEIYVAGPVLGIMVLIVELHRRRRGS